MRAGGALIFISGIVVFLIIGLLPLQTESTTCEQSYNSCVKKQEKLNEEILKNLVKNLEKNKKNARTIIKATTVKPPTTLKPKNFSKIAARYIAARSGIKPTTIKPNISIVEKPKNNASNIAARSIIKPTTIKPPISSPVVVKPNNASNIAARAIIKPAVVEPINNKPKKVKRDAAGGKGKHHAHDYYYGKCAEQRALCWRNKN